MALLLYQHPQYLHFLHILVLYEIHFEPDEVKKTTLLLLPCFREDVTHLSLYNLSVIHKKKYFDSEMELMAYINDNWERLQLGEVYHT